MFDRTKFTVYDFSKPLPSVTITQEGARFNATAAELLHYAPYVVLLLDRPDKQFALKPCDPGTAGCVRFFESGAKGQDGRTGVLWDHPNFLRVIAGIARWDLSMESFEVEGQYVEDEDVLLFDLKKAVTAGIERVGKKKKAR